DAGYAEYYFLPPGHYVFKVPDVLPDEAIPPVNCALCQVLHGLEYADMKFGDVVVIQGAGGLGIYAAAVAAEKGASRVISIDGQTPRLEMARQCGATDVIDIKELSTPAARIECVTDRTDGPGAEVVVEVVGLAAATVEGLDMVRCNGKFIDIGNIVPQAVSFPAIKVIAQQIHWTGLMHYDPWIMPSALDFLVRTKDRYPLTKVVSHSFPLAEVNTAFAFAEWQGKGAGRAATPGILKPGGSGRRLPLPATLDLHRGDRGHAVVGLVALRHHGGVVAAREQVVRPGRHAGRDGDGNGDAGRGRGAGGQRRHRAGAR